jgi:nucleoside triphosphate pyrophosphatase
VITQAIDSIVTEPSPTLAEARPLVLASASETRRRLLTAAGVSAETLVAGVDEAAIKHSLEREGAAPAEVARTLAELKAVRVSSRRPGALVIGADQVLVLDDRCFDKPADLAAARAQLLALRGREHRLLSAVAVALDGQGIWRHQEEARLRMRPFSDGFLDDYLARAGDDVLGSVGAYRLEGLGAQLFAGIRGDYFAILGLPLLALLDFLRGHGAVAS